MSNYIKAGNTVRIQPGNSVETSHKLFPGIYSIGASMQGIWLETMDVYQLPAILLGDVEKNTERVITTFQARPGNTGVLMSGLKGSGKSLLAKCISLRLLEQGVPTVVVNNGQINQVVCDFLSDIDTDCVIFLDELDKIKKEEQNCLLSLMDGVSANKKLFLVTANYMNSISHWMMNRPGRVFYNFKHDGLSEEVIRQYCEKTLKNKDHIQDLVSVAKGLQDFSFDALVSIVEECNRYDQSPREFIDIMCFEKKVYLKYDSELWFKGKAIRKFNANDASETNLGDQSFWVRVLETVNGFNDQETLSKIKDDGPRNRTKEGYTTFDNENLVEAVDGVLVYENSDGFKLRLTPAFRNSYDPYSKFFANYRRGVHDLDVQGTRNYEQEEED